MIKHLKLLTIVVCLLMSSCGYRFQGGTSVLPDDIKTVYIPLVENETAEPGVAIAFTEILKNRFDRYGIVKVVERKELADSIFKVKVVDVKSVPKGTSSNTDIEVEMQLTMVVNAELTRKNGQILWKQNNFAASDDFGSTTDTVVTTSASFSSGGIGAGQLDNMGSREVARGQSAETMNSLMEEMGRQLYISSVAADF
ncbi:MAG: hypothetical protein IT292_05045 [Deltaproteobacteria bacterium]|nr:hypothetical protein [Deltaproteobacteria bacterium]